MNIYFVILFIAMTFFAIYLVVKYSFRKLINTSLFKNHQNIFILYFPIAFILSLFSFLAYHNIDTPKSNYLLYFDTPISKISNLDGMGQTLLHGKFFIIFNCKDSVVLEDIDEYTLQHEDAFMDIVTKYIKPDLIKIDERIDFSKEALEHYDLYVKMKENTKPNSWFLTNKTNGWYFFKKVYD
ncbi:MAG: hypothetical protein PF638_15480 [Candidatus Delongbacteria bacterium]|jgi:hypothetical protein|nr:hypothetical protein [Candidatus Delongbacteria bacterium]